MWDYVGAPKTEEQKDLFDLAVDWMDKNPVRWSIATSWAGAGITLAILATLSYFQK
ncbi:MAG: hypothetical protein KA066_00060 [Candidatus Pacebacteria bacterium]|nr:hypothetical protein [Candidatus Paceibacterota bacterium]